MPLVDLIEIRHNTAANATASNPTLAEGEPGFETDTYKLKIGDGSLTWTSLPYIKIGDDQLTSNVPLKNAANTFSTDQTINTRLGIGEPPNAMFMLDMRKPTGLAAIRLYSPDNQAQFAFSGTFGQFLNGSGAFYITNNDAGQPIHFRTDAGTTRLTLAGTTGLATFANDLRINGNIGFYNTAPGAKPTISGSRGGNAALADLLAKLAALGLLTDSTS